MGETTPQSQMLFVVGTTCNHEVKIFGWGSKGCEHSSGGEGVTGILGLDSQHKRPPPLFHI